MRNEDFRFDHEILRDPNITLGEAFISLGLTLPFKLQREKPDLVIVSGFSFSTVWVMLMSAFFQFPFIIWTGETRTEASARTWLRAIRTILRQSMVRRSSAFIVYGSEAGEYLRTLSVPKSKIFVALNTVDIESIRSGTTKEKEKRTRTVEGIALPGFNILFVGYLEKRKGVHLILNALQELRRRVPETSYAFHIVGSGTEERNLIGMVREKGLSNVHFWGFRQKEELPMFYSIADVLVFPSTRELYGLVPIEAMAAGLPVLCSKYAGCTVDLIQHGVNGLIIDPDDTGGIANDLMRLKQDQVLLNHLAHNAQSTVLRRFTLDESVRGFVEAMRFIESLKKAQR